MSRLYGISLALLMVITFFLIGCSDSNNSTEPDFGDIEFGEINATIAGDAWVGWSYSFYYRRSGITLVVGTNPILESSISLTFPYQGEGTYTIGQDSITSATYSNYPNDTDNWVANYETGSGQIIITSISATDIEGTFAFTATKIDTVLSTETIAITNGIWRNVLILKISILCKPGSIAKTWI